MTTGLDALKRDHVGVAVAAVNLRDAVRRWEMAPSAFNAGKVMSARIAFDQEASRVV